MISTNYTCYFAIETANTNELLFALYDYEKENKTVKKTLTFLSWLNDEANSMGINLREVRR